MKIQFVSPSPRAGEIVHIDNQTGKTLVASGFAREIPYKDFRERLRAENPQAFEPVVATVQWSVAQGMIIGRFAIRAQCSSGKCSSLFYDSSPDHAASVKFVHSCGCQNVETVPAAIVEQYRSLWKKPVTLGHDVAVAAKMAFPTPSKPVDLYRITDAAGNPMQPIAGPRPGATLVEGDEKSQLVGAYQPVRLLKPNRFDK